MKKENKMPAEKGNEIDTSVAHSFTKIKQTRLQTVESSDTCTIRIHTCLSSKSKAQSKKQQQQHHSYSGTE